MCEGVAHDVPLVMIWVTVPLDGSAGDSLSSLCLLIFSVSFPYVKKLLGNSLLKLEGDDRLDMNCTLPFSDQVGRQGNGRVS